jgi:hypothetical protein
LDVRVLGAARASCAAQRGCTCAHGGRALERSGCCAASHQLTRLSARFACQGTAGCQAQALLDFLRETECETMYLVGDVVDLWESSSGRVFWPQVRACGRALRSYRVAHGR